MFLKVKFLSFLLVLSLFNAMTNTLLAKPKLMIGIVVDQMRYDYIEKYKSKFSKNGFLKLQKEGFTFHNMNYNYFPTFTGPGHASIFTGTYPNHHGIVGNNWYSKTNSKGMYCTDDDSVKPIGSTSNKNKMSPKNLISSTIGDELKLLTNGKSKVFGISMKDRASILPAGHAANCAYWFDSENGNFITSSYYGLTDLPEYVKTFNNQKLMQSFIEKGWNTLLPIADYTESSIDNSNYEQASKGENAPVFPHNLKTIFENDKECIRKTPFGNTITKEFAKTIISNENLGKDEYPDFLTISFSCTDYIGHQYGISSIELEDCYIRLDLDLADLLKYLDAQVGKDNYTLFLTADHGAAYGINNYKDFKINAGNYDDDKMGDAINQAIKTKFGLTNNPISKMINQQIYLDKSVIESKDLTDIVKEMEIMLLNYDFIKRVYNKKDLLKYGSIDAETGYFLNGFHPKRSGDIIYVTMPYYMESKEKGTTHGSEYGYDTRVPMLWYGKDVKKGGQSFEKYSIDYVAPTASQLLECPFPGSSTGGLLKELFKK